MTDSMIRVHGLAHKNVQVEDGINYAIDVVEGRVLVCRYVLLACQRFMRDLERAADENDPLLFSYPRAQHVLDFATHYCVHVKGKRWRGKPVDMMDFHAFILINIFGFIRPQIDEITGEHFEDEDGDPVYVRRFTHAMALVARKNAKSFIASVVGNYMTFADGEGGSEVYSAATTRQQAKIVFDDAKEMIRSSERLRQHLKTTEKAIFHSPSYSRFMPVSSEAGTLDGLNIHCAIIDEIHAHKKRDLYDVLETATGARDQPLIFIISTAGVILDGICIELKNYGVRILEMEADNEETDAFFFIWYTMDEEDIEGDNANTVYDKPDLWFKANPGMGVCKSIKDMKTLAGKARNEATARANFQTKHLNIFVNGTFAWCDMTRFRACKKSEKLKFTGKKFIIGVDLAEKIDICAAVKAYYTDNGHIGYQVKYWLPEGRLITCSAEMRERYEHWYSKGWLKLTEGDAIDIAEIEADIKDWVDGEEDYFEELAYDPWHATQFAMRCAENNGWNVVEVPQVTRNLNEAMRHIEETMLLNKLYPPGDGATEWMMSNVQANRDRNGNIFPDKSNAEQKIDSASALFTATSRIIRHTSGVNVPDVPDDIGTL